VYWDGQVSQEGNLEEEAGLTIQGDRKMIGQGTVKYQQNLIYEFKGEGEDSMYLVEAPNYRRWTYSSLIDGTINGLEAVGEGGGFRSDMYIFATGGDVASLEARGNGFWFDYRIQERFDSVAMDIYLIDQTYGDPNDCPEEPKGWIGLRDENAYWYDLVFMPKDSEDDAGYLDEERSVCDGCGTLYLRGVQDESYGEYCPDFSSIWNGDIVDLPDANDFLLTIQQLQEED
jgi:hypothetical protein